MGVVLESFHESVCIIISSVKIIVFLTFSSSAFSSGEEQGSQGSLLAVPAEAELEAEQASREQIIGRY